MGGRYSDIFPWDAPNSRKTQKTNKMFNISVTVGDIKFLTEFLPTT